MDILIIGIDENFRNKISEALSSLPQRKYHLANVLNLKPVVTGQDIGLAIIDMDPDDLPAISKSTFLLQRRKIPVIAVLPEDSVNDTKAIASIKLPLKPKKILTIAKSILRKKPQKRYRR